MKVKSIVIPLLLSLFVVLLNACQESNTVNLTNDGEIVNGTLRGIFNYPIQYATVYINDQALVTNELGQFYAPKTKFPYDVYYKDSLSGYEILYKDVSQSSIGLLIPRMTMDNLTEYNIVVHYPTLPPEQRGRLFFVDEYKDIVGFGDIPYSDISFSAPSNIYLSGNIYLISYVINNNHISGYKYFATKYTGVLAPGITEITIKPEDLDTLSEYTINCSITPPASNTLMDAQYMVNFNSGRRIFGYVYQLQFENFTTNNFSLVLPKNLPGDICVPTLNINTFGGNGGVNQIVRLNENTSAINIQNLPSVTSPENFAMNVDSNTVFTFQKQPGSNVLIFNLYDTVINKSYRLCTTDNSITLKMLTRMVRLQPNKTYSYNIEQVGNDYSTVGDFLHNVRTGPSYDGTTSKRYFTTKP